MNTSKKYITVRLIICALLGAVLALTTHIYIYDFTKPFIDALVKEATDQGVGNPNSSHYSKSVILVSYTTAFISTIFLVFCYYHCQILIPGNNKLKKWGWATLILFGLKAGDLIRQPLMDFILNKSINFKNPLLFVIFQHADKWLANVLLSMCIVYLCPAKTSTK